MRGCALADFAAHFRTQADWCERLGSPFTARLLERAAINIDENGVVAGLTDGWPGDPAKDALALRMAGALHAAALSGRDEALAGVYPAPSRNRDIDDVWPLAEGFLRRESEWVRAFMTSAPQTNEVGRSGVLAPAFLWLASQAPQPFHMLELGASAGLNMNWDQFRYAHAPWGRTAGDGPLIPTVFEGDVADWREIDIASRAACDLAPVDPDDPEARLRLRAYVWPDQFDRLERLEAAIGLARRASWRVECAGADQWVAERLAGGLPVGTSVVYHSIFLQYPPAAAQKAIADAIETAGASASGDRRLAWVRFEPEGVLGGPQGSDRIVVNAIVWDGSGRREVTLGDADPHGWKVRWLAG